jgi:hypothetical protein
MKIGSIVIHCHDFDRTVAFWQAALHYVPREPAKDGWVVLRDPEDKGPNLSFQGRDRRPRKPATTRRAVTMELGGNYPAKGLSIPSAEAERPPHESQTVRVPGCL